MSLQVDHMVSVADEGDDDFGNLLSACQECNVGKGAFSLTEPPLRTPEETAAHAHAFLFLSAASILIPRLSLFRTRTFVFKDSDACRLVLHAADSDEESLAGLVHDWTKGEMTIADGYVLAREVFGAIRLARELRRP